MKKLSLPVVFSQNDPTWKNTLLGFNSAAPFTIGNYGCRLSCFAMFAKAIGKDTNPAKLNDDLKATGQFSGGGNLNDDNCLNAVYGDVKVYYRSQKYEDLVPDSLISKIKSLIDEGYLLIAEVDFYPSTAVEDMHFVVIYGYGDNGEWYTADPWTGTKILLSTYGDVKRVLYRVFCYDRKLATEEAMICLPASVNDGNVKKATQWDKIVSYLEIVTDPLNTLFEDAQRVVAGFKSRITDLQTRLTNETAERENREEQVSRLKDRLTEEEALRKELQEKLTDSISKVPAIQTVYEDRIKVLNGQLDQMGKEKGELNRTIQTLKTQNDQLMKNQISSLTVADILVLLFNKLKTIKLK